MAKKSFLLQVLVGLTRMPVLLICNSSCAEWCKIYKDLCYAPQLEMLLRKGLLLFI